MVKTVSKKPKQNSNSSNKIKFSLLKKYADNKKNKSDKTIQNVKFALASLIPHQNKLKKSNTKSSNNHSNENFADKIQKTNKIQTSSSNKLKIPKEPNLKDYIKDVNHYKNMANINEALTSCSKILFLIFLLLTLASSVTMMPVFPIFFTVFTGSFIAWRICGVNKDNYASLSTDAKNKAEKKYNSDYDNFIKERKAYEEQLANLKFETQTKIDENKIEEIKKPIFDKKIDEQAQSNIEAKIKLSNSAKEKNNGEAKIF